MPGGGGSRGRDAAFACSGLHLPGESRCGCGDDVYPSYRTVRILVVPHIKGSHKRPPLPPPAAAPPTTVHAFTFVARRAQRFLLSSARVELRMRFLGAFCESIFAQKKLVGGGLELVKSTIIYDVYAFTVR